MALPELRPVDRIYISSFMTDVSTASSCFIQSPVRGYVKKIRGELYSAITGANSAITAEINNVAITGATATVLQSGSAAGDSYTATPTTLSTSFVNVGDSLEVVSDGASSTAASMNWVWEIEVL